MENDSGNGILEDFRIQFLECWHRLPNKGLFLALLGAWLALFQFVGNSTLGYIDTPSLLNWMRIVYTADPNVNGSDDRHALLIPFLVLGLFWWKRKELLAVRIRTWSPGLLLVAFALALHLLGYMAQQPRISIVALFLGIYGFTGMAWGPQWLRESFFPFCLFAFCVPLGWLAENITFPLRLLVCQIVQVISGYIFQIDVLRQGTQLLNPEGHYQYEVAAACSGIRSLFAIILLAIVYAMLGFRTWWKRGLLILSGLPLAVLGNVVRMLSIVIAAEIGGQKMGETVHDGGPGGIYSLLPYAAVFVVLLSIGHWLRETAAPTASPAPAAQTA